MLGKIIPQLLIQVNCILEIVCVCVYVCTYMCHIYTHMYIKMLDLEALDCFVVVVF